MAALAGGLAYVAHRFGSVLHYRWDWGSLGGALLHWSVAHHAWRAGLLLEGLEATLRLALWSSVLTFLLGFGFALCRISRSLYWRLLGGLYVGFVRNMPLLVFLFLFYFFLSSQILPLLGLDRLGHGAGPAARFWLGLLFGPPRELSAFVTGVFCLALFEGAYVAEILRAGLQAVPRGQWEAALGLGLGRRETLWRVILPQALMTALRPYGNEMISIVKASAVTSLITVLDIMGQTRYVFSQTYDISFYLWAAVFYLIIVESLRRTLNALETRMTKHLAVTQREETPEETTLSA